MHKSHLESWWSGDEDPGFDQLQSLEKYLLGNNLHSLKRMDLAFRNGQFYGPKSMRHIPLDINSQVKNTKW